MGAQFSVWRKLACVFRRRRLERELAEEIETHRVLLETDLNRSHQDGRETAARRMGNITLAKEESNDVWTFQHFENFVRDLRYGSRMLVRSPGFTAVAVITLALGIGANTAMYSVVNTVLFRPLPYKDPDRLADLWRYNLKQGIPEDQISYPDVLDLKSQSDAFDGIAAYRETQSIVLTGRGEPERLDGVIASANIFDILGAKPALGRGLREHEDQPGKEKVAILSHHMWNTEFKSDPHIIGKPITLDGDLYSVVGVMPAGFQFPISADPAALWLPIAFDGAMARSRGVSIYNGIARLRPGVTAAQASAQMDAIYDRLVKQYRSNHTPGWHLRVVPQLSDLVHDSRDALIVLFAAVGMVLLIACANVANLILARGASRAREMAVRAALGAGRVRVICQLLTESLLLGLAGGVLGLVAGYWAIKLLAVNGPHDIPRLQSIGLDGPVFVFALVASLATGTIAGIVPTLRISKVDLAESLKERTEGLGSNRSRSRVRDLLVVSEIALSLVTVLGAGLLIDTLWHLERANPGFDPNHVLTFNTELPDGYHDSRRVQFYDTLLLRIRALPGVLSASAVFPLPFVSDIGITTMFEIEGRPSDRSKPTRGDLAAVDSNYFLTMHIPVLKGHGFEDVGPDRRAVAIINKEFARRYFPNQDPLGKRIKPDAEVEGTPAQMSEIVGVVDDVKLNSLREDPRAIAFVPLKQLPIGSMTIVARTQNDPRNLLRSIRAQVRAIDGSALVFSGKTLDQYIGVTLGQPRFNALLLGVFAALALTLSVVGVYGAVSYAVNQRVHEIGIRTALGATPGMVLKLVLGTGLKLTAIGVSTGLVGAVAVMRLMRGMLFGVSASDPAMLVGVAILLAMAALIACYVPARRALRVDPIAALRYE